MTILSYICNRKRKQERKPNTEYPKTRIALANKPKAGCKSKNYFAKVRKCKQIIKNN